MASRATFSRLSLPTLASALFLTALLAGCGSKSAAADVSLTSCQADPGGGRPKAVGVIDNHSSKASTYTIAVSFYDSSGNRVSQGGAAVGKVEPGALANISVEGLSDAKGPVTCKVSSVTRTEAP